MTVYLNSAGGTLNGSVAVSDVLIQLAQYQCRTAMGTIAALTNSIGGSPSGTNAVTQVVTTATNVPNAATNLAQEAATEAAMGTVRDALAELISKANAIGATVGYSALTDSTGGAAADGTAGAVTVATTAAATGVQAADWITFITAVNAAVYNISVYVNKCAVAGGKSPLVLNYSATAATTIPAMSVNVAAAADPGVTKAVVDADLTAIRTNLTTVATVINTLRAGAGAATVVPAS
jgi:hypothetical protein